MTRRDTRAVLEGLLAERILLLDGAMGTMIQAHGLDEAAYRGERFADWPANLKGNMDVLSLTQPEIIRDIHAAYLEAGADIIETNTFNSTAISQAEYGFQDLAYRLNLEGARLARAAADPVTAKTPEKPRLVAGVLGPTNRTASISPDVSDPGFRNVDFDALVAAYAEAARGLIDGGADILLVETVFDTLNCKAAIYAILRLFDDQGVQLPVMISGTITDASGRTLSGQTPEAFWNSVAHSRPISIGLNCALGVKDLRPHVRELARAAGVHVSVHPNAGLPNAFGGYDETPDFMAEHLGEFARAGLVNVVGGCCGTTPEHIRAIAAAVEGVAARPLPEIERRCRLSGLEPLSFGQLTGFVNIGERTNVAGSARFKKLVTAGDYAAALEVARQQVANGAQMIDVNMDEAMLESKEAMETYLKLVAVEPDIARVPIVIDSSKWSVIEAGLKCVQGKGVVNSISLKEGEEAFVAEAREVLRYGARGRRHGLRREGSGGQPGAQGRDLRPRLPDPYRAGGLPARGHHLRSQHLRHRHRHRGARGLRGRLHRGHQGDQAAAPLRHGQRRRQQPVIRVPRQRSGARGHAHGVPVPRGACRHGHGDRQRRPARHLRRRSPGAGRAGGRRGPEPSHGRRRSVAGDRQDREGQGQEANPRPWRGGKARWPSG